MPEEAEYFISSAKVTLLLTSKDREEKAEKTCFIVNRREDGVSCMTVTISYDSQPQDSINIGIDDMARVDPDGPGAVLLTSGTTGRPKGVVLPRKCIVYKGALGVGGASLNHRAAHWIGGSFNLVRCMIRGTKLYQLGEKAGAEDILNAFRRYWITRVALSPLLLRHMKELLTSGKVVISPDRFQGLSEILCTAGTLEQSSMQFWTDFTGLPFRNLYGLTEMAGVAITGVSKTEVSENENQEHTASCKKLITCAKGVIGIPIPNVQVKLSEGNHGEIRLKYPGMMIWYVFQ
jgi:malonyl-CoA/methylmalonyl-CoA synthetase